MNIVKAKIQNFRVVRTGLDRFIVKDSVAAFMLDGLWQYREIDKTEFTDIEPGHYSLWLKTTWQTGRVMQLLPITGFSASAQLYSWHYYGVEAEFAFGKTADQALLDGTEDILQFRVTETEDIYYLRIADIEVTETSLEITNNNNVLILIPDLQRHFTEGAFD